jgi:hypothetical protein
LVGYYWLSAVICGGSCPGLAIRESERAMSCCCSLSTSSKMKAPRPDPPYSQLTGSGCLHPTQAAYNHVVSFCFVHSCQWTHRGSAFLLALTLV